MPDTLMKHVTLDNFTDFISCMVETAVESDGDYYEKHSYEIPVQIRSGNDYNHAAARATVLVRKEGVEEPTQDQFGTEDEYKVFLHNFNATPEFSELIDVATEAISEDLHKLLALYSHVYYEETV